MHSIQLFNLILSFYSLIIPQNNIMIYDEKVVIVDSTGTVTNDLFKYDNGFIPDKFRKFELNDRIIFLKKSSGIVYEMKNDSIIRIDNSYDDNVHNFSLDFVYRDTLFRFGGYGYFNNNKNLIFYDEKVNEWDIINFDGHELIEPFNYVGVHFIRDNKLHVFGYFKINFDDNSPQMVKKGFVLDLEYKKITKTFNLNNSFEYPRSYFDLNQDYVLLINTKRKSLILNKETLEFYSYKLNVKENSSIYDSDYFILNNKLYYESDDKDSSYIVLMNIDSLIDNMKNEGDFIKSKGEFLKYFLITLICLISVFIIRKIFLKKKHLFLDKESLHYGPVKISIDNKMFKVLSLLLNHEKVSNNQLLEVFFVENQNKIHINREKNNCIDRINLIFDLKTKKQLILKKKSLLDGRMIEYYINKDLL